MVPFPRLWAICPATYADIIWRASKRRKGVEDRLCRLQVAKAVHAEIAKILDDLKVNAVERTEP